MSDDAGTGAGQPDLPALSNAYRDLVLLVEDESMIALDVEDMLGDMGFREVVVCSSYESAEEALEKHHFPLAVFDLNLNGHMSTPLILKAHQAGTRIVLATGYEGEQLPFDDIPVRHLQKPYTMERLASAIHAVLAEDGPDPA